MRITLIVSLLISIVAVIFALQNPQSMMVQLGTYTFQGTTALVLLITFALGVTVGILAALPGWIRNRRKVSSLRTTLADERVEASVHRERKEAVTETPPSSTERAKTSSTQRPPEEDKGRAG